jgi:predicted O-linked N-acetylglucosamine transferase (SPINDLY family)
MSETRDDQPEAENPAAVALQAKFNQGIFLHQQGKLVEAERIYREILQQEPNHFAALHLLGVVALNTRRIQFGIELITKAIKLSPNVAGAHSNLGFALIALKRFEEALASYDKAIALKPDFAEAYYDRAIALYDLKRHEEALVSYEKAIELKPDLAEAHNNRGNALGALKRPEEALESYDKAIALKSDYVEALNNRGVALTHLKRFEEALDSYNNAIALKPNYAEAYSNRGAALIQLNCVEDALASCDKAISLEPNNAEAHNNRGNALTHLKRFEDAIASYEKAIALKPDFEFLYGSWLHTKMMVCDWINLENEVNQLVEKLQHAEKVSAPFPLLAITNSLELQRRAAENWTACNCPLNNALPTISTRSRREKIRIGYFSADFREHPVAILTAELFERHDRSQFEVTAFSFGSNTKDEMRRRLEATFDNFIDIRSHSDRDVALLARKLEIDIAVDLMGHTRDSRAGIFSMRAAPVQVNYLGYAGTMGATYMDYLIADPTVIFAPHRQYYTEKIAYLPNTYIPNDSRRLISDRAFNRAEFGLPQSQFVFCCFNNSYKLNPGIFDCWMKILRKVEGSILWLSENNAIAAANLQMEADIRDINPRRLVFATRMPILSEHLARHRLADLFLDTLPCNAHTTTIDALWAGLPVVTRIGETFAGRVAASLLTAIGLTELITSTPQAYEDLAVELATNPEKLESIKQKLTSNRLTTPLFDTQLFTRHIETAYKAMYERHHAGVSPDHIYVPK